jgi:signal transduction histidine kinase
MRNERILIIDDEDINRRLLEEILLDEGYDVVEAPDGPTGLALIARSPVDLVLLDVMMPGMNGFEVCRRIRSELGMLELPVVFVTALGDRDARIRAKDVGADEFLTKPVDDLELLVRVRALLRLKAAHDAREKQRRLMSTILDSMNEGVVAVSATEGYTLCNRAAERILGPLAGWPAIDSWPLACGDDARPAPLAQALAGESVSDARVVLPAAGHPHGRHVAVSAQALPEAGADAAAVAVFRDVTELVHLDQFKHEMTSLVVHDLKNVMVVIGANVDYAMDVGDAANQELQDSLHDARDAAARALRLIANLMDVARLENSALELRPTTIEPDAVFTAAMKQRSAQLRTRGIAARVDAEANTGLQADAELLQRVIDNVLDNAVRYTPAGGRIALAVRRSGDRIQLRIGNSGAPIPPDERVRIFEKYGQASPGSGGKLNAGLGLYFCRLAVEAHQGRMWVESEPDLATVFVIDLPVKSQARRLSTRISTVASASSAA